MHLKYWHNNAYDTVTLHANGGEIVGSWTVTPRVAQDFADARMGGAESWEPNGADWSPQNDIDECLATVYHDGVCQCRSAAAIKSRLEFHGASSHLF